MTGSFDDDGFAVLPGLLPDAELACIDAAMAVPAGVGHGRLGDAQAIALRDAQGVVACPVPRGGVMLRRPLLLHASSKATGASRRRVLHFLFGLPRLPLGLAWAHAPAR